MLWLIESFLPVCLPPPSVRHVLINRKPGGQNWHLGATKGPHSRGRAWERSGVRIRRAPLTTTALLVLEYDTSFSKITLKCWQCFVLYGNFFPIVTLELIWSSLVKKTLLYYSQSILCFRCDCHSKESQKVSSDAIPRHGLVPPPLSPRASGSRSSWGKKYEFAPHGIAIAPPVLALSRWKIQTTMSFRKYFHGI